MKIYNDKQALENVLAGAKLVFEPVKTTMGPKGRNVLVRDKFGKFTITHDGVTVAKAVNVKDAKETIGVEVIKEASRKMDEIGDGTTSVTVLTYALIEIAKKFIDGGGNPMIIKRELEAQIEPLVKEIKKRSKKIGKDLASTIPVATISAGDPKLGDTIARFIDELGYDGAISVETTQAPDTSTEIVKGFTFDRGYMSPYFATDAREAKLDKPVIVVTSGTISEFDSGFDKLFFALTQNNVQNVLVIAENVEIDALNTFILNTRTPGQVNFCVVKAPGHGDAKLDNLKDICAYTGATLIDPNIDGWADNFLPGENRTGIETVGYADKVVVTNDETTIIGGAGNIDVRVAALKARLKKAKLDEIDGFKERVARLEGKVGIIKVGGITETDAEERKYRIDDAIAAVRAAIKEGVVAGGGVTLRDVARSRGQKTDADNILFQALQVPQQILYENSGIKIEDDDVFKEGQGVDVFTGKKVDMIEAGIIDPTQVTIDVLRNAITTACLAITVGGAIVDEQLSQEDLMNLMNQGR